MSLIKNAAFFLNTVLVCKNRMFQSVRTKLELGLIFKSKNKKIFLLYFISKNCTWNWVPGSIETGTEIIYVFEQK
jgi:hypothetical protein